MDLDDQPIARTTNGPSVCANVRVRWLPSLRTSTPPITDGHLVASHRYFVKSRTLTRPPAAWAGGRGAAWSRAWQGAGRADRAAWRAACGSRSPPRVRRSPASRAGRRSRRTLLGSARRASRAPSAGSRAKSALARAATKTVWISRWSARKLPDLALPAVAFVAVLRRSAASRRRCCTGSRSARARCRASAWTARRPRSRRASARRGCRRAARPSPVAWSGVDAEVARVDEALRLVRRAGRVGGQQRLRRRRRDDLGQRGVRARVGGVAGGGAEAVGHGEQAGARLDRRRSGRCAPSQVERTDHWKRPNGSPASTGVNAAVNVASVDRLGRGDAGRLAGRLERDAAQDRRAGVVAATHSANLVVP